MLIIACLQAFRKVFYHDEDLASALHCFPVDVSSSAS
jgi:hypothetical protein